MSNTKLARCVCGGAPRTRMDGDACEIKCPKCGHTTGWVAPKAEAISYWNYKMKTEVTK